MQRHGAAAGPIDHLVELVQHDRPAEGDGERRDEHAMIAARQRADDGAGGEAAEAVGDQVFLRMKVAVPEVNDA
jgi:hypothetical protein